MRDMPSLSERLLCAGLAGLLSLGGGLFLMDFRALKSLPLGDRQWAALTMSLVLSFMLAGAPAGWVAGKFSRETMLPFGLACAGAYAVPVAVWFGGFGPGWPACWVWGWLLAFAGGWLGLGLGLLVWWRKQGRSS